MTPAATLSNAAESDFGSAVALSASGTTALIAEAEGADVFHVAKADLWRTSSTPKATLVPDAAGAQEDGLLIAVALSADGTTALIGTVNVDTFLGAAYIFRATAADAWVSSTTPSAVLDNGGLRQLGDDLFGEDVALSPDGTTALIGAPSDFVAPAAYVFQAGSPDSWASTGDPDAVVRFVHRDSGWSVALSGEGTALVGEPSVFAKVSPGLRLLGGRGAADLLHVTGPKRSWRFGKVSSAKLSNAASPPAPRSDFFGYAVGLSSDGTIALVSADTATFIFTRAGSRGARYCYVPYVDADALPTAERAIESTHCRLGTVTWARALRVRRDHVISQRPEPGARLAKGARVDLSVSKGRGR